MNWHQSYLPSPVAQSDFHQTATGKQLSREAVERARQSSRHVPRALRKPQNVTCWHDMPEVLRKMIVHIAGLDAAVIKKIDRDLSEVEKAKIRDASRYMREEISQLVAL